MATNQYLPFGTAGGANVLAPAAYSGLAARLSGFTAGTAVSAQLNTVWRQSSVVSAMIGEFILDYGGFDALDDGSVDNLETGFARTLQKQSWLYATIGGTATALTMALTPAPASWTDLIGVPLRGIISATNTGACTLNVNGLGAKSIKIDNGSDPIAGDLKSGSVAVLVYDGTNVQILFSSSMLQARLNKGSTIVAYFTAGSFSWNPPANVRSVFVRVWGAGAGGGGNQTAGAGGGGGGGGYAEGYVTVTPGTPVTVTVGAGGAGGAGGNTSFGDGGAGGSSSFGPSISATGGNGGKGAAPNSQGISGGGGGGVGGHIQTTGGQGSSGSYLGSYGVGGVGGAGGSGGGPGGGSSTGLPSAGQSPGGGGGGGGSNYGGAIGAPGGVIIEYFV